MENVIKISVVLACVAVARGNLPKIVHQIRRAQIALIQETKASNWMKAKILTGKW